MPAPEKDKQPAPPQTPDDGPQRGERGEYLPATYPTSRGNVRTDR